MAAGRNIEKIFLAGAIDKRRLKVRRNVIAEFFSEAEAHFRFRLFFARLNFPMSPESETGEFFSV